MSVPTRERIRVAARERFARDGYDRATIRAIAADAGIDPALVMRHFGSKQELFAAAAEFELRLPDLDAVADHEVGGVLLNHFLDRWEEDDTLQALLRVAATNPDAANRMQEIFAEQVLPGVIRLAGDPATGALRAGLAASHVLGIALTRYVLRFRPVVEMSRDDLVAWVGPSLQRYLLENR